MREKCFLHHENHQEACSAEMLSGSKLTSEQRRLLRIRSKCKRTIKAVCRRHLKEFITNYPHYQNSCCNPFKSPKCKKFSKSLYSISMNLRDNAKRTGVLLTPGKKLCVACKIVVYSKLKQLQDNPEQEETIDGKESSQSVHSSQKAASDSQSVAEENTQGNYETEQLSFDTTNVDLEELNKWLENQGFPKICVRKIKRQDNYDQEVLKTLKGALEKCSAIRFKESNESLYYKKMVDQLKKFLDFNTSKSKIVLALSTLPKSMSVLKIQETFGVTNYMARKSRSVVENFGILHEPGSRKGQSFPEEIVMKVTEFYLRDDVSRPLPGKKDEVPVREANGEKVYKRKRLILGTLGSLHTQYLEEHPFHKLSRGKFCELRPKECVLAGQAGTHVICVCTYHENPSLMFEHGHLQSENLKAVRDCRALMLCPKPDRDCFLRKCENCPEDKLQEVLEVHFDSEMIDQVTYNQWESTDRGNMATLIDTAERFISKFISQVEILIPHDSIYKEQVKFFKSLTDNLEEGEVIASCDFGENYTVVIQRSSQSNYFNGQQITLHPFVVNYLEDGVLKVSTLLIISDHLEHSTTAVNVFQKKLIEHLKNTLQLEVKKIYYVSDGCAPQYKNKKAVANVWFHEADFGIPAEWHYHATAHGKSACDGVAGRAKNLVYRHSLQATNPSDHITTAVGMAQWLKDNVKGITTVYVASSDVVAREAELMVRKEKFTLCNDESHVK